MTWENYSQIYKNGACVFHRIIFSITIWISISIHFEAYLNESVPWHDVIVIIGETNYWVIPINGGRQIRIWHRTARLYFVSINSIRNNYKQLPVEKRIAHDKYIFIILHLYYTKSCRENILRRVNTWLLKLAV